MVRRYEGGELVEIEFGFRRVRAEVIDAERWRVRVRVISPYGYGMFKSVRPWQARRLRPANSLTNFMHPVRRNRMSVVWGIFVLVTAAALGACGAKASATNVAKNPQVQLDSQQAQQIIDACLTKGDILTHTGRVSIVHCIAPKGHTPQFEACAQQQLSSAHLTTTQGREQYLQAVFTCGEKNR